MHFFWIVIVTILKTCINMQKWNVKAFTAAKNTSFHVSFFVELSLFFHYPTSTVSIEEYNGPFGSFVCACFSTQLNIFVQNIFEAIRKSLVNVQNCVTLNRNNFALLLANQDFRCLLTGKQIITRLTWNNKIEKTKFLRVNFWRASQSVKRQAVRHSINQFTHPSVSQSVRQLASQTVICIHITWYNKASWLNLW